MICYKMLKSRSRGFIQQHLIGFDGGKEFLVKASGWDQVNVTVQPILQIQQLTAKFQASDAALGDSKVNIALFCHVPTGEGAKEINALSAVLLSQFRHDTPDAMDSNLVHTSHSLSLYN